VKPPNFKYVVAHGVEEALTLLEEYGDEARVLAGGQSLVQLMNARAVTPGVLVDVNPVVELDRVDSDNGTLRVGALTRTAAVEGDADVAGRFPVFAEAASRVGHLAVRNRGTVGGNLAHADPAANLPPVMLALDAVFVVRSNDGERAIPAADFFLGPYQTVLAPTELLTEVRLPGLPAGAGSAFLEVSRRGRGWGLAGVAAAVVLDAEGRIADARLGLSGVGPTAVRARDAEDALRWEQPTEEAWGEAARAVVGALEEAPSDIHASAGYRRHLAGVLVRRALAGAASRTEGGS
jgi:carbon-monoxide dehydrogenase medium subunit